MCRRASLKYNFFITHLKLNCKNLKNKFITVYVCTARSSKQRMKISASLLAEQIPFQRERERERRLRTPKNQTTFILHLCDPVFYSN